MEGYEPPAAGDQKKSYPSQAAPIIPPTGYSQGGYPQAAGYAQGGYPAAGYPPQPGFAPAQPAYAQHVPIGEDEPIVKGLEFSTESIRKGFIRKVYSILSVMHSPKYAMHIAP